jgi:hypothetical protein
MSPLHAPIRDLSRSLTPLSSIADSTEEVDRLLAGSVTPERSLANEYADEESDLSPLTSSDEEEEDIDTTLRAIRGTRTLRPRGTKPLTSTVEHATPSAQTSSRPVPSSSVEQPSKTSKKRKRSGSLTVNTSTAQEQKPKLDFYVSRDRCHQCRNLPRYAFMRCTSKDESGLLCKRLFCVSCITKRSARFIISFIHSHDLSGLYRYPAGIDFNPQLKKWKCPFCEDMCNCTKCCFKRNVTYTSTANVKIDQDTLLYYAALMPNSSNSKKQLPPPPKSSKLAKLKSARKSKSKPPRAPGKAKPAAEKAHTPQTAALNTAGTRDIESIIRGLTDTAAMFERFGCVSGEYWGVVFSNTHGGRIGVAYVGDKLPEICFFKDDDDETPPPPAKRLRASLRLSA